MDINEIKELLSKISITFPTVSKHYFEPDGKLKRNVGDEWYRCIGFMDFYKCMKLYDEYLMLPDGNHYAPDLKFFMNRGKKEREIKKNFWKAPQFQHRWYVIHGRWYDENLCEYDLPPYTAEEPYRVDANHELYKGMRKITVDNRAVLATSCSSYEELLQLEKGREHI